MKKLLAYIMVLAAAVAVLVTICPKEGADAQAAFYCNGIELAVGDNNTFVSTAGHFVAYAENGTFTNTLTSAAYSPGSGFPTAVIGGNVPSIACAIAKNDRPCGRYLMGKTCKSYARLYVLRV